MKQNIFGVGLLYLLFVFNVYSDDALYGTWNPIEYNIGGEVTALRGIMIITSDYFVGNTTFDADGDGILEANANSGPITIENGVIKMIQWMQLHWREKEPEGHFLRIDIPEDINYTVEGDRLIFHFPSGNKYISERFQE